jgi:uncharacterized protein (DUF488 family)
MMIYTIGFTKTSARNFFERLKKAAVLRVIDTRLNKESQLAGFAKQGDLPYFLSTIDQIGYKSGELLTPTADMLKAYRNKEMGWSEYEQRYVALLKAREVEKRMDPHDLDGSCLLCSEATPEHCHRRLAAEYLAEVWGDVQITHL